MGAELADTPNTTRRARGDKRRQILDAAAPVFGEHGYHAASLDEIAGAAGVSKPTIYSHFGSKEQLFRDSVADTAGQLNATSLAAINALEISPARWRASLSKTALALTNCRLDDCARAWTRLITAESTRDPEVASSARAAGFEPTVQALAGRLAMLGNAGYLDIPDPVLAAHQLMALLTAELDGLTNPATTSVRAHAAAVERGLETFLRAHAPPE